MSTTEDLQTQVDSAELIAFQCNICGHAASAPKAAFSREVESCEQCRSTVRLRSIVHVLSLELFGKSLPLTKFPIRKDLRGIGMSDADWEFEAGKRMGYAHGLGEKLDYTNSHFHCEPRLDITDPDPALFGRLDFIISTEVLEHVAPPVQIAFENARKLLKPGGVFVFTVPYNLEGETLEHFPELHEFELRDQDEKQVLINVTRSGERQIFEDLVFHGGDGQTLEMRVFSKTALEAHFKAAGFEAVRIHEQDAPEYGILWEYGWSLPMSARVPASPRT